MSQKEENKEIQKILRDEGNENTTYSNLCDAAQCSEGN